MFRSQYDGSNRVTKNEYTVSPAWNGVFRDTRSYGYAYDDSDGSLASMTLPANGSYTYTYDALKRLNTRALKLNNSAFINRSYSYLPGSGTNATTMLVSGVTNSRANGSNISSYTYGYDNVGNITSVSGSTVANYSYDNLGQLRTETYGGKTYTYTYDTAGNIVSVSDGTTTKNYVYGDSSWKDLLTSYNGGTINYDGIGNPTKWYDGTNFTWVNGRRLATAVNSSTGLNNSYTYDADGLRLTKTVNGVQHRYVWQGSQLVAEYYGGTELEFFYDESGAPYAFSYKANASATPVMYYYVTNLQGDVTNIVDASGNVNSTYSYNAWGKLIFSAGTMSAINPIRYRGYYYDTETGLYYLQSRYYDPEIGRFINADSQLNDGDGPLGYNMFAYCNNDPVMYSDPTGHSITLACIIIGAVIGAVTGGCAGAYVSKKKTGSVNGWAVAAGAVGGGAAGGLIGWGVGAAITAVGAATTGSVATAAAPVVQQVAEKTSTALQTYYPPNDGFSGAVQKITLEAGTLIQRTGELVDRYTAPAGTPTQMLSLPYDKIGQSTTILQVQQSVEVLAGRVAPWFGQIGGGIQYKLATPLNQLISEGVIKVFEG